MARTHRITISLNDIDLNNLEWLCERTTRTRSNLVCVLLGQATQQEIDAMTEVEKVGIYDHLTRKR